MPQDRDEYGQFRVGWTSGELKTLRLNAGLGARAVARKLNRSVESVRTQARRQRISLRRPGERRGRLFSQPNGMRIDRTPVLQRLREDVLAGRANLERIERRVALIVAGAPLCPGCTLLPQEVEGSGLCLVCHYSMLAQAHAQEARTIEARRLLDAERQRKHRAQVWDRQRMSTAARRFAARGGGADPDEVEARQRAARELSLRKREEEGRAAKEVLPDESAPLAGHS